MEAAMRMQGAVVALGLAGMAGMATAETVVVRQHGRMFDPAAVEIAVGDTVRLVNDDEGLLHHAYLETDIFSFDIGEQEAGQNNEVLFPVAGVFDVFCGIHPKMKLTVTVR
jgi:plastocyanin